jgi:NAD(P)-dependent dehydrogenase (short-subunit alcohol dehydrogenase family)
MTSQNGSGRVALVTGGARGIGRALCERLAADGYRVVVNYRSDAGAARALVEQLLTTGAEAVAIQADVCDPDQAEALVAAAGNHFGTSVSVLVNNVGEFSLSPVAATSVQRWNDVITSNLHSAFYVTRAALPAMRDQGHGRIVTLGLSVSLILRGTPNIAAYSVAKTGIAVLTRSLAVEEARHGITVNCVAPGLIDNGHLLPEQRQWMAARVPAGRLGTGGDIAEAVSFLISDRAAYISGATLAVAGAWDFEDRPTDHDAGVIDVYGEAAAHV